MTNYSNMPFIIHQVLHGYNDGHRKIAGSNKIDKDSERIALSLSDLSGYDINPGKEGYITGYPLPKMKSYALSRTWIAPEMPRPGCVWTHTLLIEFSDLALIQNASNLLNLFRRPKNIQQIENYSKSIKVDNRLSERRNEKIFFDELPSILNALYSCPCKKVFYEFDNDFPANIISILIWLQQWPRLRRNFRFCTLTSADRSRPNEPFDLQFVPSRYNIESKLKNKNDHILIRKESTKGNLTDNFISLITDDICNINKSSGFHDFIWRFGAETDAGRKAFITITKIWHSLERNSANSIDEAISYVALLKPPITSLKDKIIENILSLLKENTNDISEQIFDFLLDHLNLTNSIDCQYTANLISGALLKNYSKKIWDLLCSNNNIKKEIGLTAVKKLDPEKVIEKIISDNEIFDFVLSNYPKLGENVSIWNHRPPIPKNAAIILSKQAVNKKAFIAMLNSDNYEIGNIAIDNFGQAAVDFAIEYPDHENNLHFKKTINWLYAAKNHPKYLQEGISKSNKISIHKLIEISSILKPHHLPLNPEEDEWFMAIDNINWENEIRPINLCSFLLSRALSGVSPNSSYLINFSFDTVHNDLLLSRLNYNNWKLIEKEIQIFFWWDMWDKAGRVRKAVVDFFINKALSIYDFLRITKDGKTFKKLTEIAANKPHGIEYLRNINVLNENNLSNREKENLNILKNILNE